MSAAAIVLGGLLMMSAPGGVVEGTTKSVDGVPIRYESRGSGQPAVVLVHCWTCDRRIWDQQAMALAQRRQVVTLDLAGHGQSGGERQSWSIEAFAADVKAVVDHLDLKRVVLVGHSMGGPVVVEAATALGDRVAGVVLVDTLQDVDEMQPPDAITAFLTPFRADYATSAEGFVREYMFTASTPPDVITRVVRAAREAPPAMAVAALDATWRYDVRPALAKLRAPLRAINADKWPTNADAVRRHAPQFQFELIEGSGHYPMLEKPVETNAALERALAAIGAAAPTRR